jgi:hypothetical protein
MELNKTIWTDEEISKLLVLCQQKMSNEEIAKHLNRTLYQVGNKIYNLRQIGVDVCQRRHEKRWTIEETEILRKLYGKQKVALIAEQLKRSWQSVMRKALRMNLCPSDLTLEGPSRQIGRQVLKQLNIKILAEGKSPDCFDFLVLLKNEKWYINFKAGKSSFGSSLLNILNLYSLATRSNVKAGYLISSGTHIYLLRIQPISLFTDLPCNKTAL